MCSVACLLGPDALAYASMPADNTASGAQANLEVAEIFVWPFADPTTVACCAPYFPTHVTDLVPPKGHLPPTREILVGFMWAERVSLL